MGVIIGIDYGKKRIGLAHTDPNKMIASGLCTLSTPKVIEFLENYLNHTPIEKFVIGQPKQKIAFKSLIESGANKKARKDKALVDQISATLILQSFLDSISKTVI
jgi:putative Holliday junction resolvase